MGNSANNQDQLFALSRTGVDKKQHLSRKDGFRLIYLVSKTDEIVVFLDIYPKNGPLQQLDLPDEDLKSLVREFIVEAQLGSLKDYTI